jgi:hypothetical protein
MLGVPGDLFGVWLTAALAPVVTRCKREVVASDPLHRANNPQDEASPANAFPPRIAWKYCKF